LNNGSGVFGLEILAVEEPWSVAQRVIPFDYTALDCQPQSPRTDAQEYGCLAQIHPFLFGLLSRPGRNSMFDAKCTDAFAGPTIPLAGSNVVAVQRRRDEVVTADQRQTTNDIDGFSGRCGATLAASATRYAELGMDATSPMDNQDDFASF